MPRTTLDKIALTLRVLMGAWFLYAGGLKIFASGLPAFVQDIENYRLLTSPLAEVAAYLVPWLEVVAGLCFMLGALQKGAWMVMFALVTAFTVSVGSAWARGLDISCGCLGGAEPISYWKKAIEFAIYYATLALLAFTLWRPHRSSFVPA